MVKETEFVVKMSGRIWTTRKRFASLGLCSISSFNLLYWFIGLGLFDKSKFRLGLIFACSIGLTLCCVGCSRQSQSQRDWTRNSDIRGRMFTGRLAGITSSNQRTTVACFDTFAGELALFVHDNNLGIWNSPVTMSLEGRFNQVLGIRNDSQGMVELAILKPGGNSPVGCVYKLQLFRANNHSAGGIVAVTEPLLNLSFKPKAGFGKNGSCIVFVWGDRFRTRATEIFMEHRGKWISVRSPDLTDNLGVFQLKNGVDGLLRVAIKDSTRLRVCTIIDKEGGIGLDDEFALDLGEYPGEWRIWNVCDENVIFVRRDLDAAGEATSPSRIHVIVVEKGGATYRFELNGEEFPGTIDMDVALFSSKSKRLGLICLGEKESEVVVAIAGAADVLHLKRVQITIPEEKLPFVGLVPHWGLVDIDGQFQFIVGVDRVEIIH